MFHVIHLKHRLIFSEKKKKKKICMQSAAVVIGALRVNVVWLLGDDLESFK